jgi:hypothetical protein
LAEVKDVDLRDRVERRLAGLDAIREGWIPHWREIASYCQPRRSQWLNMSQGAEYSASDLRGRLNSKIYDDHGIWATQVCARGMSSGLASASRPWMKAGLDDTDLMEFSSVKEWLADFEREFYAFVSRTNFYTASNSGYLEQVNFGTEGGIMLEHPEHGAVCHSLTAGEYWIALDDALKPAALYRRCMMTADQLLQQFGRDKVSDRVKRAYEQNRKDQYFPINHAIERNVDRLAGKRDRRNKPWLSVWWEQGSPTGTLLDVSGYEEQPFWAPRWDTIGADVYGYSPAMNALPSIKQLQVNELRAAQATDYIVRPALRAPAKMGEASLNPGSLHSVASVDSGSFAPIWEVPPQVLTALEARAQRLRHSIDRATYADMFMAITNMEGVQPRNIEEIARRQEEKLTQLGPVVERNFDEKLRVVVDRVFGILYRSGRIRPAPREMEGKPLKIEFVSILAQMQQIVGLGAIERTMGFAGNLAAVFPSVVDKIDADQAVDEYGAIAGTPPRLIRSDDAVEEIREQRAQQERMAQAASMAPALHQGADAAKLLSETDVGGGRRLLQNLIGT